MSDAAFRAQLDQSAAEWAESMRTSFDLDVTDESVRKVFRAAVDDLTSCLTVLGAEMSTEEALAEWLVRVVTACGGDVTIRSEDEPD